METRNSIGLVMAATVMVSATVVVQAEVCEVSNVTSEQVAGSYTKQRTILYLKTEYDNRVAAACSPWKGEDALDHWHYGDYWPLYTQFKGKVPEGARAFVKNNPQPTLYRFACWDHTDNVDTDNGFVGVNAYEWISGGGRYKAAAQVDALCAAESGQGYGLLMLNRIADEVKDKLFLDSDLGLLTLSAVTEAMPFYNSITLSCNGGDENNYTAQVTKTSVIAYKKRGYYLYTSGPHNGQCAKVHYDCESLGEYQQSLGQIELWAGENDMTLDDIIMPRPQAEEYCGDLSGLPDITLDEIYANLTD